MEVIWNRLRRKTNPNSERRVPWGAAIFMSRDDILWGFAAKFSSRLANHPTLSLGEDCAGARERSMA